VREQDVEGSWKLRLHRTSPVVGSERTWDDVELFRFND
jgi:hypothetical protein